MSLPLAVLVDAENISVQLYTDLKREVLLLGTPIIWQVHGGGLDNRLKGWAEVAGREGLDLRVEPSAGKNVADMAIAIAAMDILRSGVAKGFCIASSDSDFAPLARRLKAENLAVHGFGDARATEAFRKSCTSFRMLGAGPAAVAAEPKRVLPPTPDLPTAAERARLEAIIVAACRQESGEQRVAVAEIAQAIRLHAPELAGKLGGSGKFLKTLERLDLVDIHAAGPQRFITPKRRRPTLAAV